MFQIVISILAGGLLGGGAIFLWRNAALQAERKLRIQAEGQIEASKEAHEREIQTVRDLYEQRIKDVQITKEEMQTTFRAAASVALQETTKQKQDDAEKDLKLIKTETVSEVKQERKAIETAVSDLGKKLDDANKKIEKFETERVTAYAKLEEQIHALSEQEKKLITETGGLKSALTTSSSVRGRWGELVLKNILQASGLVEGIDFIEQAGTIDDEGNRLKPDFVVKLPNCEYQLAIDAKNSLHESYLDGEQATTEEDKQKCHAEFAKKIHGRAQELSGKAYEKYVTSAVPYVVMFIPSEAAIRAAFSADPDLFKWAASKRVIITSPATIIPLVLVIANAWKQFKLSADAQELSGVVKELGSRLQNFVTRLSKVQKGMEMSASAWNDAIGKSWLGPQSVVKSFDKAKQLGNLLPEIPELTNVSTQLVAVPMEGALLE